MAERPHVFAYYFPNWHEDSRNAGWFGESWTEWELVRHATPRFDGHRQPRVPAGGEIDEADPRVAAEQIHLAHQYGIDGFLVDFYWYDDGPYLNGALDRGLVQAENREEVQLAIMWANHDLVDIFPRVAAPGETPRLLRSGAIDRAAFERMARHVVEHYFSLPNYYRVDGRPWFSIYEIGNLIAGLGGVDEAREALAWFDGLARAAGHDGIHFDAVIWGVGILPSAVSVADPVAIVPALGFSSVTSYVWVHHADLASFDFPAASIDALRDSAFAEYEDYVDRLDLPFHPNVTVGWDSSPRISSQLPFTAGDYPAFPVWDTTPDDFERGLRRAQKFVTEHPTTNPIVTINAWNEWSEGSALLPDTTHGLGYLERVLDVFGPVVPVVTAETNVREKAAR